jgi:peptidyl-prolyl cis-trans isomerase D
MIRFLQTPGKTKKFILAGILLFFCLTLVITLVPGIGGDSTLTRAGVLAKVGGEDIKAEDLQKLVGNRPLVGPIVDQALQYLIREKAMLMEADRLGLTVTDNELVDFMHKGQYGQLFFPKGEFIGQDKYTELLQNQGISPTQFEKELKTQILLTKLQNTVTAAAQVPPEDVQREFLKQNTKVKLQYAVVNGDAIAKTISPTESELKAFYDQRKTMYSAPGPEKRKARYVVIDVAKLQDQVKPTPDELQRYYNDNREQFRQPEEVKASHILISVPPKADAKTDDAARAKAEDILKQLKAGANFADMAKKYSEDEGTAKQGGSYGPWLQHGTTQSMGTEFDRTAFSTPPGQISGVIKTDAGYQIIKIDDKHEAHLKTLEEEKQVIQLRVAGLDAQKLAESLAATVTNLAGSKGLDFAAAANHLEVTPSDWFARTDSLPGIGTAPEFMDAVFGAKEKSPPTKAGISTGYVVFQLAGVKPPVPPTYEDVRDKVLMDYKQEQTNMLVSKKAQELSNRAHTLNDLARAAKELGAKLESTSEFKGPNDQVPDLGSLRGGASAAFSMKRGEISSPIRAGSNNAAVFTLLDRQDPTPADFAKSGDQIRETLLEQKRGEIFQLYAEGLKQTLQKEGKIKVNQQELDTYTKRAPETSYNY